ncbi:MAG: hypothetical protein JWQ66_363 [Mucilaginibacter sp.]|nr:hypothetical protein [Mucilaginibacter sp.]
MSIRNLILSILLLLNCFVYTVFGQSANDRRSEQLKRYKDNYQKKVQLFKQGKLAYAEFLELIQMDKQINKGNLVKDLAISYKSGYLDKLPDSVALTKDKLSFFAFDGFDFINSKDRYFRFLMKNPSVDDSILVDDKSPAWYWPSADRINIVLRVVEHEDIISKLYDLAGRPIISPAPDFLKIESRIKRRYPTLGEQAENVVLGAEIKYFKAIKNWEGYCKSFVVRAEKFGFGSVIEFATSKSGSRTNLLFPNQLTESLVLHCEDPNLLKIAITWEQQFIMSWFAERGKKWIKGDTPDYRLSLVSDFANYAGLLYKSGRKDEAIQWLQLELKLVKEGLDKNDGSNFNFKKFYVEKSDLLLKMNRGDKIDESWEARWFY